MRRRAAGTAGPQIQDRHVPQHTAQIGLVAHLLARGQRGRAGLLGGGQVPGLDQDRGHDLAEAPMQRARVLVRDPQRLAREPESAVPVAVVPGRQAEAGQRHRLQAPGAALAAQVQRPAAVLDGLSDPAHPKQRR